MDETENATNTRDWPSSCKMKTQRATEFDKLEIKGVFAASNGDLFALN